MIFVTIPALGALIGFMFEITIHYANLMNRNNVGVLQLANHLCFFYKS